MLHELRQAIFVLQATLQLGSDPRTNDDVAARIQELVALVNFYGSFSRPMGPAMPTDLATEVAAVLPAMARQASALGARIVTELSPTDPVIVAAPLAPRQILVNLFRNALDAVSQSAERTVAIHVEKSEAGVRLRVEDSGPGLVDGVAERIFDPWFTTKEADGTGLGLPLCKRLAERDGASIAVSRSELGGASFQVSWPSARPDGVA